MADIPLESFYEVVLTRVTGPDGQEQEVVFRRGGPVDVLGFQALCAKVGWAVRPLPKLRAALANSYLVASLTLESLDRRARPRLVGLARATSDGVFNATLWDVVVDPDFQGQGLGRALVRMCTQILLRLEIANITLFADARTVPFYRDLGFQTSPGGIQGMFWYADDA